MSVKNDWFQETQETPEPMNEKLYNCTECSSPIEMLSINEEECTIEFECINNKHKKKMLIKEYINKMKNYNDSNINNDRCNIHNLKYEFYCLDCNIHLCKECLKLRNHFNHFKNNIIEAQPTKKEIKIFENIIKYYEDKLNKAEIEKINENKKKLNNKSKEEIELKENKNKIELDSKKIDEEYINNINDKNENEIIIFNNKIEKINIKENGNENQIENLKNLIRLNKIINNTYDNY